ncbi:zinc finger protein 260-like [Copidosoma floridanum]|uniref:zinc finger protein 260-like n=1 Tax=Copidosoma floridanum TaxID=29053 RepID=UPI000C6F7B3C|nr:zinc finger protein 260-like [Copidosoma floridanum]
MTAVTELKLNYLCRFCASKIDILMGLPIFEENEQSRSLNKKISTCLPVKVSSTDQLPKIICGECAFKVDELFDFHEKVLQTENLFTQMIKALQILQNSNAIKQNIQSDILTIPVLNSIVPTNGRQVIQTGIIRDDNEVDVFQLDKETARMFDEHMRQLKVTNQDITMHLDNNISINLVNSHLDPIDINSFVTSLASNSSQTNDEQITDNCRDIEINLKEKNIPENIGKHQSRENNEQDNICNEASINNGLVPSFEIPSVSQDDKIDDPLVQYTKSAKDDLIASVINNPSVDQASNTWYVCPFCNEVAAEAKYLTEHFVKHFCCCPKCELYFTSVDALNLHIQSCLDLQNNADVENSKNVEKKVTEHSQPKGTPKVCSICGKQYRTNYKLQEHMRKHTGEKPFHCTHCNKSFRSKIGLAQHTATHTGQFAYSCSTCGKGFQCKSYLIVHQRVHSDAKPYSCTTCSQNFKTKQSLLDHENRHAGVKPYTCEICGRSFITKGLCKSHEKIHSGLDNRQYPCHICNRYFVSKSYLATHALIHTGDKPYLCECCGKGFLTKMDLKIHMTMHTGEKNFKCDICSKDFARRSALRCHKRSHTGERPYRCEICGKTFTQFSPMAIHKRLHTGERPYECDLCGKSFVSRSTMMSHRKKHDNANEVPLDVKKFKKQNSQEQMKTKLPQDDEFTDKVLSYNDDSKE